MKTLCMAMNGYGIEVLSRSNCLQLLGQAQIGRIALSMGALPVVMPVNFAVFDGDILIWIARDTKLDRAASGAVVAFEIDGIEPGTQSGWSVLIQGMAQEITDEDEVRGARAVLLGPWVGPDDHYLRVSANRVSGSRITTDVRVHSAGLSDAAARP